MAAILRLWHLGAQSLWIDEILTWSSADIGTRLVARDLLENIHGPLYAAVVHAWCAVAGDSESALRLPSAVCGILLVPAMAWLADRWLGRRESAWAAWLTALSPFLVWYSQEARSYMMMMLWVAVSGSLLIDGARRGGARRAAGWLAVAAAGMLSAPSFAFALPGQATQWWRSAEGHPRRWRAPAVMLIALALVALPWVPRALQTWDWQRLGFGPAATEAGAPLRGATTFHAAAIPFALHAFAVGYTLGPSLRELRAGAPLSALARHAPGIATVALVFGWAGVAGLIALARARRLAPIAIWLVMPALLVSWFALANFKVFHPRYLAAAFPAFLLVLTAGLCSLSLRWRWALATAIVGLWLFSLSHLEFDPRYGKEDMRGAAHLIRSRIRATEQVLAVNSIDAMSYYYRGPNTLAPFWLGFASDSARLVSRLDPSLGAAAGSWVVLSRPEDLDPRGRFAREMDRRTRGADRFDFEGVRVWHVSPVAATTSTN